MRRERESRRAQFQLGVGSLRATERATSGQMRTFSWNHTSIRVARALRQATLCLISYGHFCRGRLASGIGASASSGCAPALLPRCAHAALVLRGACTASAHVRVPSSSCVSLHHSHQPQTGKLPGRVMRRAAASVSPQQPLISREIPAFHAPSPAVGAVKETRTASTMNQLCMMP